jgi:hypothetical protein
MVSHSCTEAWLAGASHVPNLVKSPVLGLGLTPPNSLTLYQSLFWLLAYSCYADAPLHSTSGLYQAFTKPSSSGFTPKSQASSIHKDFFLLVFQKR